MGITLVELKDGYARFRMPVRPEYLQGAKTMQGGLIVALADETIAHAMMTQLSPEEGLTTIELKSNFLAGVSGGDLIATATVFKKGQSLVIGDCLVTDNDREKRLPGFCYFSAFEKKVKINTCISLLTLSRKFAKQTYYF